MKAEHIVREGILNDMPVPADEGRSRTVSLDALVRDEYARIRGLGWRFGLPEDELEDAVQEVFSLACAGLPKFRGESAPRTWLTRIAVNHFISRQRSWRRRLRVLVRNEDGRWDAKARRAVSHELNEAHERAVECIQGLSIKLRAVFVLRYLEDMSVAEVAETLNIAEGTVRSRIYHARQNLRRMMRGVEW